MKPQLDKISHETSFSPNRSEDHTNDWRFIQDSPNVAKLSHWQHIYLSRIVLVVFIIIYSALLIGIQILAYASKKNYGLATSSSSLHYLWTYGPTAILTLIASFWARVECQTKLYAPWSQMLNGPANAHQSLLLDYLSSFQPFAIYTAIRNKDYDVAAAVFNSLLLRLIIVVSTSLIVLSPIAVPASVVPVTLTRQFTSNNLQPSATSPIAYAALYSMIFGNTSLPNGISSTYAYQVVDASNTNASILTTTVDGFFGDLDCEPATAFPINNTSTKCNSFLPASITFGLRSGECETTITCDTFGIIDASRWTNGSHSLCMSAGTCGGTNNTDDNRIGLVASVIAGSYGCSGNFTIIRSNAFICTTSYDIRRLDLTINNTDIEISPSGDMATRRLDSVLPWDIMETQLNTVPETPTGVHQWRSTWISNIPISFDRYSWLAFALANYTQSNPFHSISSLFEGDAAVRLVSTYYQQYAALVAGLSLTKAASIPSTGSAIEFKNRLIVQSIPANLMTALLLLLIIMSVIILRWRARLPLPQSPNTIISIAALLARNPLSKHLKGMGSASLPSLESLLDCWVYQLGEESNDNHPEKQQLLLNIRLEHPTNDELETRPPEKSTFRPQSLSFTSRILVSFLLGSIIVAIEILLRKSERDSGIGDLAPDDTENQLWIASPGLLFGLIGMYFGSADFDTRSQAPFLQLSRGASFKSSVALDLVDQHSSTLIITELRSHSFEALASTLALALTSFLTIFSASLFYATTIPTDSQVQLSVNRTIYYPRSNRLLSTPIDPGLIRGTLILLENASYPSFTYEDLAFPSLIMTDKSSLGSVHQSDLVFSLIVPAVRANFNSCRLYQSSEIQTSFSSESNFRGNNSLWYFDGGSSSPSSATYLFVDVEPERGCYSSETLELPAENSTAAEVYFASMTSGCSSSLWVWGSWSKSPGEDQSARIRSISALGCNGTVQAVNTSMAFSGRTMLVDTNNPPTPNHTTAVDLASLDGMAYINFYGQLPNNSTIVDDTILDRFFTVAMGSRYAVPVPFLGDAAQASTVADSILFHHRILLAQFLNTYRYNNATEEAPNYVGGDLVPSIPSQTTFDATATNYAGRRRVVQDPASSRILQSLLAAILVCYGTNWFLMRNVDVIPRSATTIGNVLALLADGNLDDFLPFNAAYMSGSYIARRCFGEDALFFLRWRTSPQTGEEVLGIYMEKGGPPAPENTVLMND